MAKLSGTCEARDDGEVGVVGMREIGVKSAGELEDLEGKIEVLLATDDRNQAFRREGFGPGFNWWGDFVGFRQGVAGK